MKSMLLALLFLHILAAVTPVLSQTITEADEMAARMAADSVLALRAESVSRDPQIARMWGLSCREKLSRLNADHLGDACKEYLIGLKEIRELDGEGRLLSIGDVISASKLLFLVFPIIIDESTILDIEMRPVLTPGGQKTRWRPGSLGPGSGTVIYEMQKRYPRSEGFEVIYLRLDTWADYIIVRRGADHWVFFGSRPFDPSMFDSKELARHEMIPEEEFIRELKSYKGGTLLIR